MKPIIIPVVLAVGGSAENDIDASELKINVATVYLNSLFRLIDQACKHSISGDTENTDELLDDIQNVCVIGQAISDSIGESLICLKRGEKND